MKIVVDWNTVVTTDRELWAAFIKEAVYRGHDVTVLNNAVSAHEDMETFADHLGCRRWTIGRFTQAQDALGADIWVHGRPDRVLGVQQVTHLYEELNES